MRAAVKTKPGSGIEFLQDAKRPSAGRNEVILRVKSVGICGSDIHIYKGHDIGNIPKLPIPFIPGHEFSGVIESASQDIGDFKVGDRVCAEITVTCGECYFCKSGQRVFCTEMREIGVDRDGAYAEYVSVPAYDLHKIPERMTFEEGSLVEPLSAALHPFERISPEPRGTVAILGAGPIGLLAIGIAKSLGYGKILSVGRRRRRMDLALEMGADEVIDIDEEDPIEGVIRLTGRLGADIVVEATGNPASVEQTLRMCRKDGQVVLAGATLEPSTISSSLIVGKSLRIIGSFDYNWLTYERAISLIASKAIDVNKVVSNKMSLDEVERAFELVLNKQAVKVLLIP